VKFLDTDDIKNDKIMSACEVFLLTAFGAALRDEDKLWHLIGASAPFILRPQGYHCNLIGVVWLACCCDQDALGAVILGYDNSEERVSDTVEKGLLEWAEVSMI
jgi:hypothetical protein